MYLNGVCCCLLMPRGSIVVHRPSAVAQPSSPADRRARAARRQPGIIGCRAERRLVRLGQLFPLTPLTCGSSKPASPSPFKPVKRLEYVSSPSTSP